MGGRIRRAARTDFAAADASAGVCGAVTDEGIISQVTSAESVAASHDEKRVDESSVLPHARLQKSWPLFRRGRGGFLILRSLELIVLVVCFKDKRKTAITGFFEHQFVDVPYCFPTAVPLRHCC